jgi:hypothetical protein
MDGKASGFKTAAPTEKEAFLKKQLDKILYSIHPSKPHLGSTLSLATSPTLGATVQIGDEEAKTSEQLTDSKQSSSKKPQEGPRNHSSRKNGTSLRALPPPQMPPLRMSPGTPTDALRPPLTVKPAATTADAAAAGILTPPCPPHPVPVPSSFTPQGQTSSFKHPVGPGGAALRHRELTKISDPYSSAEMEEKALAIIEEKR